MSFCFRVIFKNTVVRAALNKTIWSVWSQQDNRTSNILFADYNTSGSGISHVARASFATLLTASQAESYNISSAVGSDFANWVDLTYLV
jgi:pectinesterase